MLQTKKMSEKLWDQFHFFGKRFYKTYFILTSDTKVYTLKPSDYPFKKLWFNPTSLEKRASLYSKSGIRKVIMFLRLLGLLADCSALNRPPSSFYHRRSLWPFHLWDILLVNDLLGWLFFFFFSTKLHILSITDASLILDPNSIKSLASSLRLCISSNISCCIFISLWFKYIMFFTVLSIISGFR